MKTATSRDLRNHFPQVLRWVEEGEEVKVTRHGKAVAVLTPLRRIKSNQFKVPDFAAIRCEVLGSHPVQFTAEDSAFIRDRTDR